MIVCWLGVVPQGGGCVCKERSWVLRVIVLPQILGGGSLCGQASGLEILHGGEGGDVELGARTSKHILLFALDPLALTLSLSLFLCALHQFILFIHIYLLGLFECASLVD